MSERRSMSLTSPRPGFAAAVLAAACLIGPVAAEETAPDGDNGRYTMSSAPDGVIRLDTRTGSISTCRSEAGKGWSCYAVPDERAAMDAEIGRLQAENERLKAQLASRDPAAPGKTDEALPQDQALPKSDQLPKAEPKSAEPKSADGSRKIEIPLPSDQDMDRVMSFAEQAWRRLRDMANRIQKDMSGKI